MKKILIIAAILSFVVGSCKKESFDYKLYQPTVEDIDSLYFSPGAKSLIADGKATLQFVVEAYRTIQITRSDGSKTDSLVFVDYENLPAGSLKILKDESTDVGMTYSTTDASSGSATFYAQIGDVLTSSLFVKS